jgi:TolB-like protein
MRERGIADNIKESEMKKFILLICLIAGMVSATFAQELPRLAVVEFTTNVNTDKAKADAITVRNLVESQMVATRKYQIITRSDIDQLLANQRIQVSSISSAENIKKLQLQNISYILTGSVDAMGNDYAVTVRVLDVSTGQFSHSDNDLMGGGSRELYNGVNTLMAKFNAGMSAGEGGAIVQGGRSGTGVTGATATYKIGDMGPAGGYIFYDKGVFSGGWRYLEAAPAETEFSAQWGGYTGSGNNVNYYDIPGTGTTVGSGKRNTQIIVEQLKQLGESGRAAQLCDSLDFDADDWFLPSKDELALMYTNLRQKGLGGFRTSEDRYHWTHVYWSSSQISSREAWNQGFSNGGAINVYKGTTYSVRAIRQF